MLFVSELPDEVDMYSAALELSGFRTVHVHTPGEALSVCKETASIAVILDAGRYPRPVGLGSGLRVPVIVLATDGTGMDADTRPVGCERVLIKPCLPDALVRALEEVLEHRKPTTDDRRLQ